MLLLAVLGLLTMLSQRCLAQGDARRLVDSYARTKLWESCVGGDQARAWQGRVDAAVVSCRRRKPAMTRPSSSTARLFVTTPPRVPDHVPNTSSKTMQPVWFTLFDQIPIIVQPSFSHDMDIPRKRRSTDRQQFQSFLYRMVEGERQAREGLANLTCTLQHLGLVDERGDLLYDAMEESTRVADIDVDLRNDFLDSLHDCSRLSRCESYRSHIVPASLQRALMFLRCARDRRQVACVKRDLREYLRNNLRNSTAGHTVDLQDMVDRIFYVTMAQMGMEELEAVLLT